MKFQKFIALSLLSSCVLVACQPSTSEPDVDQGYEYFRTGRHLPTIKDGAIEMLPNGLNEKVNAGQISLSGFAVVAPVTGDLVRISWVENRTFSTVNVLGSLGSDGFFTQKGLEYFEFIGGASNIYGVESNQPNLEQSYVNFVYRPGSVAVELGLTSIQLIAQDPEASFTFKNLQIEQAFLSDEQMTMQYWALDYYSLVDGRETELLCGLDRDSFTSTVEFDIDEKGLLVKGGLKNKNVDIANFSLRHSKGKDKKLVGQAAVSFGSYSGVYPVELRDTSLSTVYGGIKLPDCELELEYARTVDWETNNEGWQTVYELNVTDGATFEDLGIIVK